MAGASAGGAAVVAVVVLKTSIGLCLSVLRELVRSLLPCATLVMLIFIVADRLVGVLSRPSPSFFPLNKMGLGSLRVTRSEWQ